MDIGMATSARGACGTRQGYSAVARRAEELGFAFIGVNDHVVIPGGIASRYPYSEDGLWISSAQGGVIGTRRGFAGAFSAGGEF